MDVEAGGRQKYFRSAAVSSRLVVGCEALRREIHDTNVDEQEMEGSKRADGRMTDSREEEE